MQWPYTKTFALLAGIHFVMRWALGEPWIGVAIVIYALPIGVIVDLVACGKGPPAAAARPMSALGQKQTFRDYLPNVRFRG